MSTLPTTFFFFLGQELNQSIDQSMFHSNEKITFKLFNSQVIFSCACLGGRHALYNIILISHLHSPSFMHSCIHAEERSLCIRILFKKKDFESPVYHINFLIYEYLYLCGDG